MGKGVPMGRGVHLLRVKWAVVALQLAVAAALPACRAGGDARDLHDTAPADAVTPDEAPLDAAPGEVADEGDSGRDGGDPGDTDILPVLLQGLGGRCVSLRTGDEWLVATSNEAFGFRADAANAARFFVQPSDLSTYLLYDAGGGYLLAEAGPLVRAIVLESDVTRLEDGYVSGAEWIFEARVGDPAHYQFRNRRTGRLLGREGLANEAAALSLEPAEGCAPYPEMSLDAGGAVTRTTFDDGTLFGIADLHEHLQSNFGFGGGLFHGGAFHRLGVPHALPDCSVVHGKNGRRDFFGHVYDGSGNDAGGLMTLVDAFLAGELAEDNHATAGWPDFTEWPDARRRSTHQAMYHRWLERAWMGGLRLVVQHATTDYVICSMMAGQGIQPGRYDCEDMTSIDRILDENWAMQRYIDAQAGGEGKGWFRIVQSPAEAREVIASGRLAVILGIETSNLFRCHLTPRPGGPVCDEAWVDAQLDIYRDRGVRAIFPVHKYDNRFTPGDGSNGFIEAGNFFNSGHWTNKTQDCPGDGMPRGWDGGGITFGGLQKPRDVYVSEAPNDLSAFGDDPLVTAFQFYDPLTQPAIEGDWCQNATITPLGESLLAGMMARGMIVEIDHFPARSYRRAFEILEANDYPAAGSHGRHWDGRIHALGGVSVTGPGRCQDPDDPGSTVRAMKERVALVASKGGYPAEGLGFDLNGFAGAPGPRFGDGVCPKPQADPISYPFRSYAGDVEFTAPSVGKRAIDFNTQGFVHIGMLPELIQDARSDADDDAALEPLFRSAEAYVRMWEKAERRATEIRAQRAMGTAGAGMLP